jgi:hypothetical protein
MKLIAFLITQTENGMSNFRSSNFTTPIANLKPTDYEDDFAPGLILTFCDVIIIISSQIPSVGQYAV